MPDFARTGAKQVGFRRSPFASFKQKQQLEQGFSWGKKILLILSLLIGSFLVSLALVSFMFLHLAKWQQKGPTGVVFLTSSKGQVLKDVTVLWVNPDKKEILLLPLPGNLSVHTPGSVAYSLKALYGLYAINHVAPADFLKALARNIRIDTPFFIVREGSEAPAETSLRRYTASLLFETHDPSVFPMADRFALIWYVWFSGAKITKLDPPVSITESPAGLDDLDYDTFLQKHFLNVDLKTEGFSIAVVNASAQSKLASTMGRLLTAFGLNILSVSDTPNTQGAGAIAVRDGHLVDSGTVALLKRYITGQVKVDPGTADEYRADIVVFLGKKEAVNFIP